MRRNDIFVPSLLLALTIIGILTGFRGVVQEPVVWKSPGYADTLKNPFRNDTIAYREGKKIYESNCWSCHGKSGKGDGPAAVNLKVKPADHTSPQVQSQTDGAIFWKISKGKGQMLPYERSLTKTQRWKLVNYIRKLKAK